MKGDNKYLSIVRQNALSAGISIDLNGFKYFCDAVRMILEDENYSYVDTKMLYYRIAERNNVSVNSVQKAMSYALKQSWENRHEELASWVDEQSMGRIRKRPMPMQFVRLLYYSLMVENPKII